MKITCPEANNKLPIFTQAIIPGCIYYDLPFIKGFQLVDKV